MLNIVYIMTIHNKSCPLVDLVYLIMPWIDLYHLKLFPRFHKFSSTVSEVLFLCYEIGVYDTMVNHVTNKKFICKIHMAYPFGDVHTVCLQIIYIIVPKECFAYKNNYNCLIFNIIKLCKSQKFCDLAFKNFIDTIG